MVYLLAARGRALRTALLFMLMLGTWCGQCQSVDAWLEVCEVAEADPSTLVCTVQGNVTTQCATSPPAAVGHRLLLVGEGVATSTLDLGNCAGSLRIAPNATITIRGMRLVAAALPDTYPLPDASFLALRIFTSTSTPQPSGSAPPPLLRLEDVAIVTQSCRALALHQDLACRSSPSTNFTVTPSGLHVWYFASRSVTATNVELSCSGTLLPCPCTAHVVNSAAEVLAILSAPPSVLEPPDMPTYVYLNRSMALRDAWVARPAAAAAPPLSTDVSAFTRPNLTITSPLILAGEPAAAPPTSGPGATSLVGFQPPPTTLDLSDTASLLSLARRVGAELHNLTLLQLPLGPAVAFPGGLLALPMWTFAFLRFTVGQDTSRWRLLGRRLAVSLPPEELALWHSDLVGSVPAELAGYLCTVGNGMLVPVNRSGVDFEDMPQAVPLASGGLFIPGLRTWVFGLILFEDLLLLPPRQPQPWVGQQPTPLGPPPSPSQQPLGPSPQLPQLPQLPQPAVPLCQLRHPRVAQPVQLRLVQGLSDAVSPSLLTRFPAVEERDVQFGLVLNTDAYLRVEPPSACLYPTQSFAVLQAQVLDATLLLGDPLRPRLLHLSFAAAAVNIHMPNATLALRQLLLAGLAPAALHPSLPAADAAATGTATEPPPGEPSPQTAHWEPPADAGGRGPSRRLRQGGSDADGGMREGSPSVADLAAGGPGRRRRAQVVFQDGHVTILGPPAGASATGGLPRSLTNFTSCVWALDFDRSGTPLGDDRPALLDSVVLLVPARELALLAASWVEHLATGADASAAADEKEGTAPYNRSAEEASANDADGAVEPQPWGGFLIEPAGLATSASAEEARAQLAAMHTASRLAAGVSLGSLQNLVRRLLALSSLQKAQPWPPPDAVETGADGQVAALSSGVDGASPLAAAAEAAQPAWDALAFDAFSWCGLLGRNVTLAAALPPYLAGAGGQPGWEPLWYGAPLELPLRVVERRPPPPSSPRPSHTQLSGPQGRTEPGALPTPAPLPPQLERGPPILLGTRPKLPPAPGLSQGNSGDAPPQADGALPQAVGSPVLSAARARSGLSIPALAGVVASCGSFALCAAVGLLLWLRRSRTGAAGPALEEEATGAPCNGGQPVAREGSLQPAQLCSGNGDGNGGAGCSGAADCQATSCPGCCCGQPRGAGACCWHRCGTGAPSSDGSGSGACALDWCLSPCTDGSDAGASVSARQRSHPIAQSMPALHLSWLYRRFAGCGTPSSGEAAAPLAAAVTPAAGPLAPPPRDSTRGAGAAAARGLAALYTQMDAISQQLLHSGRGEVAAAPTVAIALGSYGGPGEGAGAGVGAAGTGSVGAGTEGRVHAGTADGDAPSATLLGGAQPEKPPPPAGSSLLGSDLDTGTATGTGPGTGRSLGDFPSMPVTPGTGSTCTHSTGCTTGAGTGLSGGGGDGSVLRFRRAAPPAPLQLLPLPPIGPGGGGAAAAATSAGGGGGELVLLGELGRGAQGMVLRGRWRGLDVAVKSITFQHGGPDDDPRVRQAIHEAAISASLSHPNVVATYAHGLHQLVAPESEPPPYPPDTEPPAPQAPDHHGSAGGGGGVAAARGAGCEAQVWRLTLVQELCDGGSLRHCLDYGVLAAACRGAALHAGPPESGPEPVPARFGDAEAVQAEPRSAAGTHTPLASAQLPVVTRLPSPLRAHRREPEAGVEAGGADAAEAGLLPPLQQLQPVSMLMAVQLALQVAHGMAYLHSLGVLHGDLSSANVLLKSAPARPPLSLSHMDLQPNNRYTQQQQQQQQHQQKELEQQRLPGRQQRPQTQRRLQQHRALHSAGDLLGSRDALRGYGLVAKVADFGLSGRLEAGETHLSGDIRRSLLYSAPELVQYGMSSKASDVYAFAVLLYELASGASLPTLLRHPRQGAQLQAWLAAQEAPGAQAAALPPGLLLWPASAPAGLTALAAECLTEQPASRPGFPEISERLESLLALLLHRGEERPGGPTAAVVLADA